MNTTLLLLCFAGCVLENDIGGEKQPIGGSDSGDGSGPDTATDSDPPPPEEECNGLDDDADGQVDEGFPDDDGNGRVDCLDETCPPLDLGVAGSASIVAECEAAAPVTVDDPWNLVVKSQYTAAGDGIVVMPAIGNLNDDNGDGLVNEADIPDIAFSTYMANTLVALDGATGAVIFEASGFDGAGGVTIADVDADGEPEIVAFEKGYHVAAVDATGVTEWSSAAFVMSGFPQPAVGDLDGDGYPEVVGDLAVLDGRTGATVGQLEYQTSPYRTPILADLDQDGQQEIILGNLVADKSGTTLWTNTGTGFSSVGAVADIDGDAGGEVFFVSEGMCQVHDDDGTLLTSFALPPGNPGPPSVADFDGDGSVEIAIPTRDAISVYRPDGTLVWTAPTTDVSGFSGCSGYDVDGDGAYELFYADEEDFYIFDGATGAVRYTNPDHNSETLWEYPVIADVDGDGSAEVVLASSYTWPVGTWKGITVLGHVTDGWAAAGPTWATHDFAVTNLDPDGHVPSPPEPSWQVYNVFRARPQEDGSGIADLVVGITDICVMDCTYGPVRVAIQATNQGARDVEAGQLVNVYALENDGTERLVDTVTLPAIPAGSHLDGIELALAPTDVGPQGFEVRIDEAGDVWECDETNNTDRWTDGLCP